VRVQGRDDRFFFERHSSVIRVARQHDINRRSCHDLSVVAGVWVAPGIYSGTEQGVLRTPSNRLGLIICAQQGRLERLPDLELEEAAG
jgi:hypothetical protein